MEAAEARRRLKEAEEEARRAIQNLVDNGLGMSFKESVQELSSYDNEPADNATETFERGLDFGLYQGHRARMGAIEAAERRLREGTFGRCETCGRPISDERLEAVPWTTLCVECQAKLDEASEQIRTARTLEEDIIPMPYGQGPEQGRDPVGFDGEDTWQAVARYGTANTPQDTPPAVNPLNAYVEPNEDRDTVDAADDIVDPWADTPGQAFPELARRPGQPAYDYEDGEPVEPRHKDDPWRG